MHHLCAAGPGAVAGRVASRPAPVSAAFVVRQGKRLEQGGRAALELSSTEEAYQPLDAYLSGSTLIEIRERSKVAQPPSDVVRITTAANARPGHAVRNRGRSRQGGTALINRVAPRAGTSNLGTYALKPVTKIHLQSSNENE